MVTSSTIDTSKGARIARLAHIMHPLVGAWLPEALLFLSALPLFFYNALRYRMPVGYAGLFAQMTEEVLSSGFGLPSTVHFYGPGGIPFAYPPLGFYLAAFTIRAFRVSIWSYLSLVPPILGLTFICLAYILARFTLGTRSRALVGTFLIITLTEIYDKHVTAGGIVRGLALVWMTAGLLVTWLALHNHRAHLNTLLAAVFFGLTILTHPTYALAFGLSLVVFIIWGAEGKWEHRLRRCALIGLGGVLLSLPWWATVIRLHGVGVFLRAMGTHGGMGVAAYSPLHPVEFLTSAGQMLASLGRRWVPTPFIGLVFAGLGYSLLNGEWLMPMWFFAFFFLIGDSDRFQLIVASLMVGSMLSDLPRQAERIVGTAPRGTRLVAYAGIVSLLLGFCYAQDLRVIRSVRTVLTDGVVEAATWLQLRSSPGSSYLLVSDNAELAEWFPYLSKRVPVAAPWGAEWNGDYDRQSRLYGELASCAGPQALHCGTGIIAREHLRSDYLLVESGEANAQSLAEAGPEWAVVYRNQEVTILGRLD